LFQNMNYFTSTNGTINAEIAGDFIHFILSRIEKRVNH
jgi:hypothetical protein